MELKENENSKYYYLYYVLVLHCLLQAIYIVLYLFFSFV